MLLVPIWRGTPWVSAEDHEGVSTESGEHCGGETKPRRFKKAQLLHGWFTWPWIMAAMGGSRCFSKPSNLWGYHKWWLVDDWFGGWFITFEKYWRYDWLWFGIPGFLGIIAMAFGIQATFGMWTTHYIWVQACHRLGRRVNSEWPASYQKKDSFLVDKTEGHYPYTSRNTIIVPTIIRIIIVCKVIFPLKIPKLIYQTLVVFFHIQGTLENAKDESTLTPPVSRVGSRKKIQSGLSTDHT